MSQTEDGGENVGQEFAELSSIVVGAIARCTRPCSEVDGLLNGQCREMYVVLRAVLDIPTEVPLEFVRSDRVVVHIPFDGMVLISVIRKGLQKGTAPSPRTSEHD